MRFVSKESSGYIEEQFFTAEAQGRKAGAEENAIWFAVRNSIYPTIHLILYVNFAPPRLCGEKFRSSLALRV